MSTPISSSLHALHALRARLSTELHAYKTAVFREGTVHERVRLYDAAMPDVSRWKRAQARLTLAEARQHEETARHAQLGAYALLAGDLAVLADAYAEALAALERIVANTSDPMEVAAQAVDKAAARLAQYAPVDAPAIDVQLALDMEPVRSEAQRVKTQLDALYDAVRARSTNGAYPIEPNTGELPT